MSAKTERFPLKIGTKREEKEGKSWKIMQFSDIWPAKFSTKFDGDVLQTFRPRAHLSRYDLIRNMILLESTAVYILNLVRPVRKFRVRRGMRNSFGVLGLTSVPVC